MIKREYIEQQVKSGKFDSMTIRTADGKYVVDGVAETSAENLFGCFTDFADNCVSGRYLVEVYKWADATKTGRKNDVEQRKTFVYVAGEKTSQSAHISGGGELAQLQKQLFELRLEQKMKELEQAQTTQVYGLLEKIFFAISKNGSTTNSAPSVTGPQVTPAGSPAAETEQDPARENDEMREFVAVFEQWQKADDRLLTTVKKLAEMANDEPDKYQTYRNMLIGE